MCFQAIKGQSETVLFHVPFQKLFDLQVKCVFVLFSPVIICASSTPGLKSCFFTRLYTLKIWVSRFSKLEWKREIWQLTDYLSTVICGFPDIPVFTCNSFAPKIIKSCMFYFTKNGQRESTVVFCHLNISGFVPGYHHITKTFGGNSRLFWNLEQCSCQNCMIYSYLMNHSKFICRVQKHSEFEQRLLWFLHVLKCYGWTF